MTQAVEHYTLGSAYAEFADSRKGSISEGKPADMVLLSKDIFTVPPREILETKPIMTITGGRVVYEAQIDGSSVVGERTAASHTAEARGPGRP